MLRKLLPALAAVLALCANSFSAQAPAPNVDPDCISGQAFGAWDLPSARVPGHVRGVLVQVGQRKLVLEAKLDPAVLPKDQRGGRMDGVLLPLRADGSVPLPIAEVHGTYVVGPDGSGRFEAAITELARDPLARPERMGMIAGLFRDPEGRDDPIGRFAGRWSICR